MKKTLAVICCMWLWSLGHTSSSFFPTDAVSYLSTPTICYDDGNMNTQLIGVYAPITAADTDVTLDITVKALVNVIEISHMLVWDPNVLSIDGSNMGNHISNIAPLIGLSLGNFASTTDSTLNFNWVRFNNNDFQSLPDDAILYSVRFDIIGTIGSGTLVREFPENERPLPLSRPDNKISTSDGSSRTEIPYTGVNTLITTGVNTNTPPNVNITSPFNGQTFTTGSTISVQATASDSDGSVTGVQLFYDGIFQGTDTAAPYQWTISSLAAGTHTLQVIATDDDNATSSQTISISVVTPNVPPSVTITSPSIGQNFTQGTPIVVNANASDSDGFVSGVELFVDNVSFGVDPNAPYQWTISNAAVGSRNIRVVATDNDNSTAQAAINVNVNAPNNVAPTVAFTNPLNGQSFVAGNNLTVTATANDSDGSVTSVELIYNGMSQGIDNVAPYQWPISSLSVGTKTLQVIATDNNGATAQQTITITVSAGGGSTNPNFPSPVSTCAFNRTVNVSDTIVTGGTYQVQQNIVTNGTVNIDNATGIVFQAGNSIILRPGFSATPTSGGFFIARIEPCTTINNLPLVNFIQPFNNDILDVGSDMVVQATASDPYGHIVSVQFFYDGVLQGTDNLAPYQWMVSNLAAGTHTLRVVATDNDGATAEQTITITVSDINDVPIVQFTQPLDGDTFDAGEDLMVTATATDADGTIAAVEFYYDGVLQGTDNLAPYQWMLFGLAPGTHTLRVVATDNQGAIGEDIITINVTNAPPTVAFVTPNDGAVFSVNQTIPVEAIANDPDGTINSVTLYLDGIIQGIDNTVPYTWTLSGLAAGTYTLRLLAEDNSGAQAEATRTIQVSAPSNPPIVNFLAPLDGTVFNAGVNLTVNAIANDSDGTITKVAFYYDNILQGTDFAAPYSWVVFNLQPGLHTLRLVATDDSGATDEAVITISVNNTNTFNESNDGILATLNSALYSTATVLMQQMNDPPVVTISTPMNGQQFTVGDDLTVQASATDDGTIRNIRMQFDGVTQTVISGSSGTWDAFSDPDLANLQAGMHTIRVIAVDNNGTIGDLIYTINVVEETNALPIVNIDFPVDGGIFTAGTNINVTASASDTDGSVTGVEFFLDGNSQGVDSAAPYEWTLNSVSAGTYTLRVVATDDDNDTSQDEITITVNPAQNNAPTVSINTPLDGESFTAGDNVGVQVSASDSDGNVTGVELFVDGVSQDVDSSSPYSWTIPSINAGNYTLRAVATDNDGATAQDEISISASAASNNNPTVSIASPSDGATFNTNQTVNVDVTANDSDGSISTVELLIDGDSKGTDSTAPFQWGLSDLSAGNRTIRAVATDDDGATAQDEVSITINEASSNSPMVSFVQPNDGQTFPSGSDVLVVVDATDNGTIQYVDLFLDGNLVRREGQPPYEWGKPMQPDSQLKNMAAGTYTLEAVATDDENNTGSATITFTVSGMGGGGGTNMPPAIAFQTPTNGDDFDTGETINILVSASDSDGNITGVQLFANGQNQGTDNTAPYEWTLSTNNPGTYTLRAVATDNDGATSEQSIMITVSTGGGGGGTGNDPVVSFVTPTDGQTFIEGDDVPVEVTATDDGSVQFVDLFLDGTLVRRENGAPYEWGLPTQMDAVLQNMAPGTYTLEAVATDNQGNTGSATITFIVNSLIGTPPSVIFVVPTDGQSFAEGTNINVQANATDTDGTVTSVELFVDGVSEGIDNSDPYVWTLNGLAIGSYTLRLVATDNDSRTAQEEITINVTAADPDAPVVSFVMPTNGQDYPVGSDVVVEVSATDNQRIDFVDLFVDGVFFRRENTAPYEWGLPIQMDAFFANMSAGTYNLEAVATDNKGNTGSAAIFFTVGGGGGGGTTNTPPTVNITSPNDGDIFAEGSVVTVNAAASDADGNVAEVELFVDNVSQGTDMTAPYTWDLTGFGVGSYALRVVATDDDNATAEDMIMITVEVAGNCATSLTFDAMNSPIASGVYQASQTITTNGQVSPMPAATVTFQAGTSITLNPGFSADPTTGSFTARIAACVGGNNAPPMVNFTSPNDGQSFTEGSTINVQASASDSDGTIAQVELFMDGVSQGTDDSTPYQWTVTGATVGNRTLRVVATDDAGATAEATITIQVNAMNTAGDPVVTFVTPTDGQSFPEGSDVPVEVNATDSDGSIDFVELFLNGTLVRRENLAPFQWGFPNQQAEPALTNLAAGTYTLEAIATDNQGNTGSSTITITVTASGGNTPPQVSFSAPNNGQTFVAGDNVAVTVAASDTDGSVSTVELFYNGNSQGADNTSPYNWTINNAAAGTHTLRAMSTDNEGATSETTISINVTSSTGNSNARIAIENRTRTPFRALPFPSDTVYSFCNVRNWVPTMTDLHNRNTMRIHNEGTDDLIISNIEITDESEFTLPGGELQLLPIVIAPNAHYDLLIQFIETEGSRGVRKEIINITSNAANQPVVSASLRGAFHVRAEGNSEPKINHIIEVLGFKTRLGSKLNSGRYPTDEDVANGVHGDIVVSKVWERADPNEPVIGFNLATYIGAAQDGGGNSNLNIKFVEVDNLDKVGRFNFDNCSGFHQSILSKSKNCTSYDFIAGREDDSIDQPFRIVMDGYITDGQKEVEPETGNKRLLGIRMYKVIDNAGNEIPNHYIGINDYVKNGCTESDGATPDDEFANCDWNDNVAYFVNIRPAADPRENSALAIENRSEVDTTTPNLRAYPNPAQNELMVDLSGFAQERVTLRLQNRVGQIVYQQTFDVDELATERIDLATYSSGLYILSLQTDTVQLTQKVVVNKAN